MVARNDPTYHAAYREANRERLRLQSRQYRRENLPKRLWQAAKIRAKKSGIPFDIGPEDIVVPEYCPILGMKMEVQDGQVKGSSPSLDRLNGSLGYTKGNIYVISHRANSLKSDASIEELEKILEYMRNGSKKEGL